MQIEIPEEQLRSILPAVARLRDALEVLSARLPYGAESALIFDPTPEESR